MANYSILKAAVADVVKTNGSQAITGANLQTVLLSIINSIGGGGYIFNGVATPSTDAGTPDQNVFYIGGAGTYANFGTSVVVPPTNIAVFKYNGTWNCEQLTVENGGVFDISAFHAVGGTLTTYADLSAALDSNNGGGVPQSLQKGGMSVKFVRTYDNKYVQYRLMAQNFTTDITQWQGVDDEPTDGSDNLVKSGGVYKDLNEKVDKENGKGLIDNQYVEKAKDDEFIRATCDAEGKVLQGIRKDGSPYFPHHEMMKVDGIYGYNHVVLDNENKIVEGINEKGRHVFNAGVEISQLKSESGIESGDWLDVKIDSEDRILEGINKDGEKHISKFDKSTQDLIKGFAGGSAAGSDYIGIPLLDANFTSPVPVEITGTKGSDDAKYVFDLSLTDDAFNIRFKFKITENLLNENKSAVIAKLGNLNAVSAVPLLLTQCTTSEKYNGETKTNYWPTLIGGISLNGSNVINENHNIGNFAFYVKYIGEENEAYIENDGTKFILTIGENAINFDFTSYPTVYSLYSALRNREDLEVSYQEIENRNSNELAIFNQCKLKCVFYTGTTGNSSDPIEEYTDSAPFFIPYAVDNKWHRVEIVKIGGKVYSSCDGITNILSGTRNTLTLGGGCGVLFKDLEIRTKDSYDAEIASNGFLISSANPYILIHEGHGIDGVPIGDGYSSDEMATSVDRLYYVYNIAKGKGYIPVSISDIAEYYAGNKELPKRCISIVFDDYRFVNCLNLDNRRVFTSFGIKPALAIISGRNGTITHYDPSSETMVEISELEAARICKLYDFSLLSHTRNHRKITFTKPSTYMNQFMMDVYDADLKDVDGSIMVYPGGRHNLYARDTMCWLGYCLGIGVEDSSNASRNTFNMSRYKLVRREIGFRENISNILSKIL